MNRTLLSCFAMLLGASVVHAGNWPAWRGPTNDGISDEKDIPVSWSATQNVTWRAELPDAGNSTPIVWGDKVFVTCAANHGHVRSVLCFDRATGKQLWKDDTNFAGEEPSHEGNPYCSSSPITDGKAVYAWLGSAGFVAYDFSGKQLWKTDLGAFTHIWGNASSPVFYKETIILNCGPGVRTFIVALDKNTGKEVWKTETPDAQSKDKGEFKGSWSSALLADIDGTQQIVVDLPGHIAGFNPDTGKEIWRCNGLGALAYSNVYVGKEVIVGMSGYGGPAIGMRVPKATDHGDLTASHRLWLNKAANPQRIGTGIIIGDRIYTVEEPGIARCMDMKTGKDIFKGRATGSSWSSTEFVDGKLYSTDRSGDSIVWKPGDTLEILGHNKMDEKMQASLAFSDGQVFVRTFKALYCIGKRKPQGAS